MNVGAGYVLSILSLTPFRVMQNNRNVRRPNLGNLDHRDARGIHTMPLRERQDAPGHQRLWSRRYRNPVVMLSLGGIVTYLLADLWPDAICGVRVKLLNEKPQRLVPFRREDDIRGRASRLTRRLERPISGNFA